MRATIGVLLAAVVATGGWYYLANKDANDAASRLSDAQSLAAHADSARNGFGALNSVRSEITSIRGQLATATAGDVDWAKVQQSIEQVIIPRRMRLDSLADTAALSTSATTPATPATTPGSTATPAVTGSVAITGEAVSKDVVGQFALRLGKVSDLSQPFISSMTVDPQTGLVTFNITVDTTSAALNARYQKVVK
jgi:hypothetical protein